MIISDFFPALIWLALLVWAGLSLLDAEDPPDPPSGDGEE